MIVVSPSVVLSQPADSLRTPVFGLHNLVNIGNISTSHEAEGFPVTNLANPQTHNFWRAEWVGSPALPDDVTLDIDTQANEPIDYVGAAGHNWGSAQIPVTIYGLDVATSPPTWVEIVPEFIPADDTPLIVRFDPVAWITVRVRLKPGLIENAPPPRAAVLHVGKLLVAPRGTHVDHTPINYGRTRERYPGRSHSGNYLGEIITGAQVSTQFSLALLEQGWYDDVLDPFLKAAPGRTFFFAWRPWERPRDVGYCWLTNDPQPNSAFDTDTFSIDLQLGGIAA